MTQALIDPTTTVQYISSWKAATPTMPAMPIYSTYPNSARVCQVEPDANIFPVAEPFFWMPCADNVVADEFYYDTVNKVINPIVNAPATTVIAANQPTATGTATA